MGLGADLLMYLWVVITCSVILLFYLKIVEMNPGSVSWRVASR